MSEEILQIMITGGRGVGKTSIFRRANHESLEDVYIPAYCEDKINTLDADGKDIKYTVTDTPVDDYAKMRFALYKRMHAFVFVIDISNQNSIDEFKNIYQEIKNGIENDKDLIFSIALNKIDLRENSQNLISTDAINDIENQFNCKIIEISAKENTHINELFTDIISKIMNSQLSRNKDKKGNKNKCIIE